VSRNPASAAERPDTPLLNFAATHSAPGPVSAPLHGRDYRPPTPRVRVPSAAYPQRPSRAVLASWQRLHRLLPVRAVPEQDRITPVRHDMVDHDGTLQPSLGSACDAKRIALEEPPTGPPPAGAVAPTCRTWTLPLQLRLDRHRAARPERTVHRRLPRQRATPTTQNPPGRVVETHSSSLGEHYILYATLSSREDDDL
jgi:hypothetical protein